MHGRNRRLPSPPQLHALLPFAVLAVLGLTLVSFLGRGPFPIRSKQVVGALVAFDDSTFPNEPLLLRAIAAPGAPRLAKIKSAFNHQRLKALIDLGPQSGSRLRSPSVELLQGLEAPRDGTQSPELIQRLNQQLAGYFFVLLGGFCKRAGKVVRYSYCPRSLD